MDSDLRSQSPLFRLGGSVTNAVAVAVALSVGTWGYACLSEGNHTSCMRCT